MAKSKENALGKVIKEARNDKKITKEKLAEDAAISLRYVMSIENEGKMPSYKNLYKIIRLLGIDANIIFYPENIPQDTPVEHLHRLLCQCNERDIKAITAQVEYLLSESK